VIGSTSRTARRRGDQRSRGRSHADRVTADAAEVDDEGDEGDEDERDGRRFDDRPASELDDELDRDELHDRYYGLLQELRVLLPGVQILVAFLFTVPFSSGFDRMDATDRDFYAVSLISGLLAVIAFTTPTAFHRFGSRRSRSLRLQWGIRATRAGLVLLAISLVAALVVVAHVVLEAPLSFIAIAIVVLALVGMWVALPVIASRIRSGSPGRGQG
jgi:hypothetical protein